MRWLWFIFPCLLAAQPPAPVFDGPAAIDRALEQLKREKRVRQLIAQDKLEAAAIKLEKPKQAAKKNYADFLSKLSRDERAAHQKNLEEENLKKAIQQEKALAERERVAAVITAKRYQDFLAQLTPEELAAHKASIAPRAKIVSELPQQDR